MFVNNYICLQCNAISQKDPVTGKVTRSEPHRIGCKGRKVRSGYTRTKKG